ncbi:MAG: hydroxymethylglutaryl-CoA lyase [Myxococcota bacterium]|nr:hydroxymethylglutaryl-CoA lyase [Myxococcota bacterium]
MKVSIYEVGLRDGLQNEASFVPTLEKIALANHLAESGLRRIELTSFVSPRWIPQLADHSIVAAEVTRRADTKFSALVPNKRGLEGASEAELEEIAIFFSASETHNKKNINKSIDQAVDVLSEVTQSAINLGMRVRGYLSVVFGCPYEGDIDPGKVTELVERMFEMGVYEVSLGDTVGLANPIQVRNLVKNLEQSVSLDKLALHMHDTRGTALANIFAGLEAGIRTFDSAFGGLGGCPYAPGASGNLATEDLVYMLEAMGCDTGIDLDSLIIASEKVADLLGRTLPSKVLQAEIGRRKKQQAKRARSEAS